jgi:hypothetical protein
MLMLAELLWPLKRRQLPSLRLVVSDDVRLQRGDAQFDWKKVSAFDPETGAFVARARFCVSPVMGRVYLSGIWVEAPLRRRGYGTAFVLGIAELAHAGHDRLPLTPLRENLATHAFWQHMRELAPRSLPVTRFFHPPGHDDRDTGWASGVASSLLP